MVKRGLSTFNPFIDLQLHCCTSIDWGVGKAAFHVLATQFLKTLATIALRAAAVFVDGLLLAGRLVLRYSINPFC